MESLTRVGNVGHSVSADQTASSLASLDRCYGSRKLRNAISQFHELLSKLWNDEFPVAISMDSKQS